MTTNYKKYNIDWNTQSGQICLKGICHNSFHMLDLWYCIRAGHADSAYAVSCISGIHIYTLIFSESAWFLFCFIQICTYISVYGHIFSQSAYCLQILYRPPKPQTTAFNAVSCGYALFNVHINRKRICAYEKSPHGQLYSIFHILKQSTYCSEKR